jgi:solute:Na+ symporter, SSS family
VSLVVILNAIPGGWPHVVDLASAAGKFQVLDMRFGWSMEFFQRTYSFWAGVLGGCFLTTASHGTEQLMVQRLLSARNEKEARLALFTSWAVIMFQFTLFLVIGVILWVYYHDTGLTPPQPNDSIYPRFIWNNLPVGVAGLIMAAILAAAMSNLSAALNALASTTIMDFYQLVRPGRDEMHYLKLARWSTVGWGGVLFVIGYASRSVKSVLETGLGIASILYGALLGVFLLGLLTKRVGEKAAMVGMTTGVGVNLYVKFGTTVAWTWYVMIGALVTWVAALLATLVLDRDREPANG